MKIGVTGHQKREGIQWSWVKAAVHDELSQVDNVTQALSSLAAGSDQIFADAAISLGIPVTAVIPLEGYENFFEGPSLEDYQRLVVQCSTLVLKQQHDPEQAFFEAGKFIVEQCNMLFAIWDGEKAEGLGGTGDIVAYAQQKQRKILCFDPLRKTVYRI